MFYDCFWLERSIVQSSSRSWRHLLVPRVPSSLIFHLYIHNIDKVEACAQKPSSLFFLFLWRKDWWGSMEVACVGKGVGGGCSWGEVVVRGRGGINNYSCPSLQWWSWLPPAFSASWLGSLRSSDWLRSENSSQSGSRPSGHGSFSSSSLSWAVCLCRSSSKSQTDSSSWRITEILWIEQLCSPRQWGNL